MNASSVVTASSLVAATTLFAVFYAVEESSVDVGDQYFGTISDNSLGDVKFSRVGSERSLYFVDPDTQRTVLLSNSWRIEWDAEGELVDCDGGKDEQLVATEAMFPGDLGGDVTVGQSPATFMPSVPMLSCYNMAKQKLNESNGHKSHMAEYVRALEEQDVAEMNDAEHSEHRRATGMANFALMAYEDIQDNERALHAMGYHMADVYGYWQWSAGDKSVDKIQRYGIFKGSTGHQWTRYSPRWYQKLNSQGHSYRCVFGIRGTDDTQDALEDAMGNSKLVKNYANSNLFYAHFGFERHSTRLNSANGKTVISDWANQTLSTYNGNTWKQKINSCTYGISATTDQRSADKTQGFYITGHSLGAGVAIINHAQSNRYSNLYAYAAPENHKYNRGSSSQKSWVNYGYRFQHRQDVVSNNIPNPLPRINPFRYLFELRHNVWYSCQRRFYSRGGYYRSCGYSGTGSVKQHNVSSSYLKGLWRYSCTTIDSTASTQNQKAVQRTTSANSNTKKGDCRNGSGLGIYGFRASAMTKTSTVSDMQQSEVPTNHFEVYAWRRNSKFSQAQPMPIFTVQGPSEVSGSAYSSMSHKITSTQTQTSSFDGITGWNGTVSAQNDSAFQNSCWVANRHNTSNINVFSTNQFRNGIANMSAARKVSSTWWTTFWNARYSSNTRNGSTGAWVGLHPRTTSQQTALRESHVRKNRNSSSYGMDMRFHDQCSFHKDGAGSILDLTEVRKAGKVINRTMTTPSYGLCWACHSSQEIYGTQLSKNVMSNHLYWDSKFSTHGMQTSQYVTNHDDDDAYANSGSNSGGGCRFKHC